MEAWSATDSGSIDFDSGLYSGEYSTQAASYQHHSGHRSVNGYAPHHPLEQESPETGPIFASKHFPTTLPSPTISLLSSSHPSPAETAMHGYNNNHGGPTPAVIPAGTGTDDDAFWRAMVLAAAPDDIIPVAADRQFARQSPRQPQPVALQDSFTGKRMWTVDDISAWQRQLDEQMDEGMDLSTGPSITTSPMPPQPILNEMRRSSSFSQPYHPQLPPLINSVAYPQTTACMPTPESASIDDALDSLERMGIVETLCTRIVPATRPVDLAPPRDVASLLTSQQRIVPSQPFLSLTGLPQSEYQEQPLGLAMQRTMREDFKLELDTSNIPDMSTSDSGSPPRPPLPAITRHSHHNLGHPSSAQPSDSIRHPCPFCTKTFSRRFNLTAHLRTHDPHRPRPFTCPTCHNTFTRAHDLSRHASVHSEDKPFECSRCSTRFTRLDAWKRHEKLKKCEKEED
ncbi:hypothetical protein DFS34DRAFT_640621 [Phlyctochytrium arcticum]|nr:hypothetical protein DFS34DRAFT_640621 [Phlyctochytrium arcticum]